MIKKKNVTLVFIMVGLAIGTLACGTNKAVPQQPQQPVPSTGQTTSSPDENPGGSRTGTPPAAVPAEGDKLIFPHIPVDHIVVVIEENHSYNQIVGNTQAPFLQSLIGRGALFTNAHGIGNPSQPNYFALFSGSTQNVKDDSCKGPFSADNLATELMKANLSFAGYSEGLPSAGFTGCSSGGYARKHNPWAQFTNVPKEMNKPMTEFPSDYTKLPTVSIVVPTLQNDMHDGTIQEADSWLKKYMEAYVSWADKNRSLFIITWDEDNSNKNHIPVIMVGPMIKAGAYPDPINHYHVLRTIEDLYQLHPLGETKKVQAQSAIWK
ncbi:acid phosphatase [Paenibacillus filicis]|uniref:Acid phosphatase n=1 Tax=Paenibacillus gyeongsangnamensis TaxID=3388067 RepID=A0ABT4QED2_9BACL|nr:alkaline phosphatase family protein [Paenibacillus filicis]MCZ8515210.1 acid phosphatase [Paenibacillus filicis]